MLLIILVYLINYLLKPFWCECEECCFYLSFNLHKKKVQDNYNKKKKSCTKNVFTKLFINILFTYLICTIIISKYRKKIWQLIH